MSGATYVVTNESQLNSAITAINTASIGTASGTAFTIDVTGDLTLGSNITAINLAAGAVTLDSLSLINMAAAGGRARRRVRQRPSAGRSAAGLPAMMFVMFRHPSSTGPPPGGEWA
jgi:hypothetical protein